ncbi:hypothetical protein KI387_041056, partial [Taxus chinensis]
YIAKYASKEEKRSESFHDMLMRISDDVEGEESTLCIYRRILTEIIVERDIRAQEMCHMLLKLMLVQCSRSFMNLNVGRKVFYKLIMTSRENERGSCFIDAYKDRPVLLESISLIDAVRSWSFNVKRKKDKWKSRDTPAIIRMWPWYFSIPESGSEDHEKFFWSELLLYKPFCDIRKDISSTREEILENWERIKNMYRVWHVDRKDAMEEEDIEEDDDDEMQSFVGVDGMDEWEFFSGIVPPNQVHLSDLHMLGRWDFDLKNVWDTEEDKDVQDASTCFIEMNKSMQNVVYSSKNLVSGVDMLSRKQ